MSDDLKIAKSAIVKLHQDMEAINRLAKPSYLNVIEQMERTMEPLRRRHLEISRALDMSGVAARMKDIIGANQHWQDMLIKQVTATNRIAESFTAAHQSWIERIKPIQHDFSQFSRLQASAKLALCDASLQLTASERLMADIDFETIKSRFPNRDAGYLGAGEFDSKRGSLIWKFGRVNAGYFGHPRLPAFVLSGATREIYTTSFALETLRPWDERDEEEAETEIQLVAEAELETSGCIALLQQVDPRLARPYIGARDALYGNNADRARHILSSLRELWNHLLRRLAPENLLPHGFRGLPIKPCYMRASQPAEPGYCMSAGS